MNFNILTFVEDMISLFANWFSFSTKKFAWRRIEVDNHFDRY